MNFPVLVPAGAAVASGYAHRYTPSRSRCSSPASCRCSCEFAPQWMPIYHHVPVATCSFSVPQSPYVRGTCFSTSRQCLTCDIHYFCPSPYLGRGLCLLWFRRSSSNGHRGYSSCPRQKHPHSCSPGVFDYGNSQSCLQNCCSLQPASSNPACVGRWEAG